ncbi:MAG: ribosome recycling factor [Victivallaceae bacterium]|nr:ribosome recycling factor [Victivallaceae bacterium]
MDIEIDLLMDHLEEEMMNTEEAMQRDFSSVRTGKASPGLVENLNVDYYGTPTRLRELAGITVPEPRMLVIQPWDPSSIALIEKAINASKLGISPVNDGRVLRLPMPELSEERRNSLVKQVKLRSEDAKISIRNVRREGNDLARKSQKKSEITEDDLKDMLKDIQDMTDKYIKKIDSIFAAKEQDLLNV